MIVFAVLALIATTPLTAEAGCVFECTGISTKILFCGNIKDGFQDTMPTIGIDARLDDCLCNQENVRLYRGCLACKDLNTAVNTTDKFISDCKINNASRNLINGGSSSLKSLPTIGTCIVAFVAIAAALTL
ncbi:hypothetical protein BGZ76_001869 [Entomortierella beljakovae]|nr:hypothetical protein BGZ76_001869 [Entomortierella beljakovae]